MYSCLKPETLRFPEVDKSLSVVVRPLTILEYNEMVAAREDESALTTIILKYGVVSFSGFADINGKEVKVQKNKTAGECLLPHLSKGVGLQITGRIIELSLLGDADKKKSNASLPSKRPTV